MTPHYLIGIIGIGISRPFCYYFFLYQALQRFANLVANSEGIAIDGEVDICLHFWLIRQKLRICRMSLISAQNGNITVRGEQNGLPLTVYTADGKMLGSATMKDGQASISTNLQRGEIAIVKVGSKSVKIKM